MPPIAPDREEIALRCARAGSWWLAGERADLVITDAASGAVAGDIGLYYQEPKAGQAMIGYSHAARLARPRVRHPRGPAARRAGRSTRSASYA